MIPPVGWAFATFHRGLLYSASLLIPGGQRAEWLLEWKSELWHVRQECVPADLFSWQAERQITSFCLGSFQDAIALRKDRRQRLHRNSLMHSSAWHCLLWLTLLLGISYALAVLLPGVDAARHSERYQIQSNLVLIQGDHEGRGLFPTIPVELYRKWRHMRQPFFDEFAFYRVQREVLAPAGQQGAVRSVVHASTDLFSVLGLPAKSIAEANATSTAPVLILSYDAWQRDFGGDPEITDKTIRIGKSQIQVAGVAPNGMWRLPGEADAWLLESDSSLASDEPGYLIGHLSWLGKEQLWGGYGHITAYDLVGNKVEFGANSFEERTRGPWGTYLFVLILSCIALPAASTLSVAEYSFTNHRPSWTRNLVRRGFLCTKILLILGITYFASLDMTYWTSTGYVSGAVVVQFFSSLIICLVGLRWAIQDQRQRCPICLRRATHPARVGLASMTFLAWNGTELMCAGGHALLHVPGVPTSWFSTPRWLYLDTSWESLFAG